MTAKLTLRYRTEGRDVERELPSWVAYAFWTLALLSALLVGVVPWVLGCVWLIEATR